MAPTARPVTIAETRSIAFPGTQRRDAWRPAAQFLERLVRQRQNLAFLEVGEEIVVRSQRVVVRRRERLVVGLDQAFVLVERVERLAHLRPFGRSGLGD